MSLFILIPALFIISACYASVGLGGGSAYLAVLSFWDTNPDVIRPMAWALNIVCSGVVFWNYARRGFFNFRIATPYLIGGLLGSVLGARIPISEEFFRLLLATVLFIVSIRMIFQRSPQSQSDTAANQPFMLPLTIGGAVGILSGLVGIGGGIVLGPIIIGLGWLDVKHTAPITSLFIFVSSAGAFLSFLFKSGGVDWLELLVLGITVNIGGFLGSRFGSGMASPVLLKRIFAGITLIASIRLYGSAVSSYFF